MDMQGTPIGSSASSNNTTSNNASKSTVDTAPGYVASVVSQPTQSGKPHGKNITEGGFDDDPSKNASFNSDIGTEQDPGRAAVGDMQKKAQSASGPTGPRQGVPDEGQQGGYGVLDTDQNV